MLGKLAKFSLYFRHFKLYLITNCCKNKLNLSVTAYYYEL